MSQFSTRNFCENISQYNLYFKVAFKDNHWQNLLSLFISSCNWNACCLFFSSVYLLWGVDSSLKVLESWFFVHFSSSSQVFEFHSLVKATPNFFWLWHLWCLTITFCIKWNKFLLIWSKFGKGLHGSLKVFDYFEYLEYCFTSVFYCLNKLQ